MRTFAALLVLAGCGSFELSPIELDVSTNCNAVDVVTIKSGIESSARPWHTIVAAVVDRAGSASGWLLVVRAVPGGLDQLALVHIDDDLQVDRDVVIDLPIGLVDQLELVAADRVGVVYLTQRAPGTFYVRRYDASLTSPFDASSQNLATVSAPCDLDHDGVHDDSCDASGWFQDLVFFGDDESQAYALTFPPMSDDASVDVTPTPLDDYLSLQYPLKPERTLDFSPKCDEELPEEELELCQTLIDSISYRVLEAAGLARDVGSGIAVLALYREVRMGAAIVADAPLILIALSDTPSPVGFLRVDPELPSPRNEPPRGVAIDHAASYLLYMSTEGSPVLARATHTSPTLERLDGELDIPTGMTLLQLEEDVALHRVVDGAWEILKLFPDAPRNSELTVHAPEPGVEAVIAAGRSLFIVRTTDSDADLVELRCAVATIP